MDHGSKKLQRLCLVSFVIYLIGLTYFTIFAESLGRTAAEPGALRYNLVLFTEIRRFWVYRRQLGLRAFILNVIGNVLVFMPCGFLLPAISVRCRRIYWTVPAGLLISLLIESSQLLFRVGSFDVDDILLNTAGALLGFLLNRAIRRHLYFKKRGAGKNA